MKNKIFIYSVISFVAVAVVAGVFIAGSPATERARRFDTQRVNDLSTIQSQAVSYFEAKGSVPQTLGDLADGLGWFSVPSDPETGTPYRYTPSGKNKFEICATFSLETQASEGTVYTNPEPFGQGWNHRAGEFCFSRSIDEDLYPSRVPTPKI